MPRSNSASYTAVRELKYWYSEGWRSPTRRATSVRFSAATPWSVITASAASRISSRVRSRCRSRGVSDPGASSLELMTSSIDMPIAYCFSNYQSFILER